MGSAAANRFNNAKPRLSLVPSSALKGASEVLAFGAEKYGRDNWRKGLKWTETADSLLRHLYAFLDNSEPDTDYESGVSHLKHALVNAMFLVAMEAEGFGEDDRLLKGEAGQEKPSIRKGKLIGVMCFQCGYIEDVVEGQLTPVRCPNCHVQPAKWEPLYEG